MQVGMYYVRGVWVRNRVMLMQVKPNKTIQMYTFGYLRQDSDGRGIDGSTCSSSSCTIRWNNSLFVNSAHVSLQILHKNNFYWRCAPNHAVRWEWRICLRVKCQRNSAEEYTDILNFVFCIHKKLRCSDRMLFVADKDCSFQAFVGIHSLWRTRRQAYI